MPYFYRRPPRFQPRYDRFQNPGSYNLVTWNPNDKNANVALSNGNLTATESALAIHAGVRATAPKGALHYFETTFSAYSNSVNPDAVGLANLSFSTATGNWLGIDANSIGYAGSTASGTTTGIYYNGGALTLAVPSYGAGDVIGVAINASGNIEFYKNGTLVYTATSFPIGALYPTATFGQTDAATANFGNTAMAFLPAGYRSWDDTRVNISTSISAVANETVADFTSAAAATLSIQATGNQTLAAFISAAAEIVKIAAAANETVSDFTSAAATQVKIAASANQTIDPFTTIAAEIVKIAAAANETVANFTSSATATIQVTATANPTMAAFTSVGTGTIKILAAASNTVVDFTSVAAEVVKILTTLNETVSDFTSSASGIVKLLAFANINVAPFTSVGAAQVKILASAAETMADFTSAAAATFAKTVVANQLLADFTQTALAELKVGAVSSLALDPFNTTAVAVMNPAAITASANMTLANFTMVGLMTFQVPDTHIQKPFIIYPDRRRARPYLVSRS